MDTVDRMAMFTCFDTVNQKWGTERTPYVMPRSDPLRKLHLPLPCYMSPLPSQVVNC